MFIKHLPGAGPFVINNSHIDPMRVVLPNSDEISYFTKLLYLQ